MKRLLTLLAIVIICADRLYAQTEINKPNLSIPSQIAPAYFGPNAFPIPDMSDGRVTSDLKLELYGDGFLCQMTSDPTDDIIFDLFARATIPLFSDRVNLVIWMPVIEWFHSSPPVNRLRSIPDPERDMTGIDSGDAYVSTDILLIDENKRGMGDHPISIKTKLSWQIKDFSIDLMHQAGIQHWPFHQLRLGTTWSYPILKTRQAAHQ